MEISIRRVRVVLLLLLTSSTGVTSNSIPFPINSLNQFEKRLISKLEEQITEKNSITGNELRMLDGSLEHLASDISEVLKRRNLVNDASVDVNGSDVNLSPVRHTCAVACRSAFKLCAEHVDESNTKAKTICAFLFTTCLPICFFASDTVTSHDVTGMTSYQAVCQQPSCFERYNACTDESEGRAELFVCRNARTRCRHRCEKTSTSSNNQPHRSEDPTATTPPSENDTRSIVLDVVGGNGGIGELYVDTALKRGGFACKSRCHSSYELCWRSVRAFDEMFICNAAKANCYSACGR